MSRCRRIANHRQPPGAHVAASQGVVGSPHREGMAAAGVAGTGSSREVGRIAGNGCEAARFETLLGLVRLALNPCGLSVIEWV
jgi:hypothetical protein